MPLTPVRFVKIKLSDVKVGDKLLVVGDFVCMRKNEIKEVFADCVDYLYIVCDHKQHYLDGEADDDGVLIGLLKAT